MFRRTHADQHEARTAAMRGRNYPQVLGVLPCHTGGAGEKVAGVLRWTKKVSRCVIGKKKEKEIGKK